MKLGFAGLGDMGSLIVPRLMAAGHEVVGWNRTKSKADALYCVPGPLMTTNRVRIVTLALAAKLPAIYGGRDYVDAGGFISYGPDLVDNYRRAANFVDKILRGTNPADIPVEQPTKLLLFVNLTTAKTLGLTIPQSILLRADDVIE